METLTLIPTPDSIPAPAWFFQVLNILTFLIHILFVNIILGGSILILMSRLTRTDPPLDQSLHGVIAPKIPTTFALAINFGVAPLLFIQVIYGQFIYTSSVLMAVYWILVIPLLIIAYYGAYIHIKNYSKARTLSVVSLMVTTLILLYIAFVYVNNMTLMMQPDKWASYFQDRGGTLLNAADPSFLPRYLHFIVASVAISGLFIALVWYLRSRNTAAEAGEKINSGLKIYAIGTSVQVVVGFWYLLSLPRDLMLSFMGGNMVYTIILAAGIVLAMGSIITGFLKNLKATLIQLGILITIMVITRANLRTLYLADYFKLNQLTLKPQTDVMILFLLVFIIGLVAVGYMIKIANSAPERRKA
ncbi:hypothetical protein JXB12_00520 [candidate division KSB1 bacterium]|nr:hypothetical protein [candidate division KSB1 bacterium]